MRTRLSFAVLLGLFIGLNGCTKSDPPMNTNPAEPTNTSNAPTENNNASSSAEPDVPAIQHDWNDPASYFTDDVVAVIDVRPKQVWDFPALQKILNTMYTKPQIEKSLNESINRGAPIDVRTIEQVQVLFDKDQLTNMVQLMDKKKKNQAERSKYSRDKYANAGKFEQKKFEKIQQEINAQYKQWNAEDAKNYSAERATMPFVLVRCSQPIDKQKLESIIHNPHHAASDAEKQKQAENKTHAGNSYKYNWGIGIHYHDEKTAVIGGETLLQRILAGAGSQSEVTKKYTALNANADLRVVLSSDLNQAQLKQVTETLPENPLKPMLPHFKSLTLAAKVTGKEGEDLLQFDAGMADPQKAEEVANQLNGFLQIGKVMASGFQQQLPPDAELDNQKELQLMVSELVQQLTFIKQEDHLQLTAKLPKGYNKVDELMLPPLLEAQKAYMRTLYRNNMRSIGLGFHNFYDVHRSFPRANGDPTGMKTGLSWRVYLTPYLDAAPLHRQFNFDQPWDSPQNKPLADKMPDSYLSEGVTDPSKSSLHVFTSKGTPFENDKKGISMKDIKDGKAYTILFVRSGADKADVWSKPGGLTLDADNPIKSFGNVPGDEIVVVMANGMVKRLNKNIDPKILKALIQHQDGEKIPKEKFDPFGISPR